MYGRGVNGEGSERAKNLRSRVSNIEQLPGTYGQENDFNNWDLIIP